MKNDPDLQNPGPEAVAAAAAGLQADGKPVTIEAVIDALGAGSPNAVARHLAAWRAEHAAPPAPPAPEIPAAILADLTAWARRYADEAGAGARDALAEAGRELAFLADAGERLEAERDELEERVEDASTARDQAMAAAAERDEEIERLNAELRNARQVAMDALVGKAKDQLAIDGKDAQLADLRSQLERNVAASASQSDARLAAEMELVGAVTARDSMAAELEGLRRQLASVQTERTNLRAELETLRNRAK